MKHKHKGLDGQRVEHEHELGQQIHEHDAGGHVWFINPDATSRYYPPIDGTPDERDGWAQAEHFEALFREAVGLLADSPGWHDIGSGVECGCKIHAFLARPEVRQAPQEAK